MKSPREQEVTLQLGSDDGVIVWLNDKLVHLNGTTRSRKADQDAVTNLTLKAGWNRLLIKVENQGGTWGFLARFAEGKALTPITDLDISPQLSSGVVVPSDCQPQDRTFSMSLSPGLHILSLSLKPDSSFTARSFAEKLSATLVIEYNDIEGRFSAFLPTLPTDGFLIKGGFGYIVNLKSATDVTFTGQPWANAAPAQRDDNSSEQKLWAFVVGGRIMPDNDFHGKDLTVTVTNLRSGAVAQGSLSRGDCSLSQGNCRR